MKLDLASGGDVELKYNYDQIALIGKKIGMTKNFIN